MKKWIIGIAIVIALIVIYSINWGVSVTNGAIDKTQGVNVAWGEVEANYQRRNDLIGNLANTVQGVADFEKSTLVELAQARARATQVTIDPSNITPEQLEAFNEAQGHYYSTFSRILMQAENYPDLKSTEHFKDLRVELASTENEIRFSRIKFNRAVQDYNGFILRFPNSLLLGQYKEKPYFKSDAGAEKAVPVNFNFDKK